SPSRSAAPATLRVTALNGNALAGISRSSGPRSLAGSRSLTSTAVSKSWASIPIGAWSEISTLPRAWARARLLPDVVDGDDMRVIAELAHGLGRALDAQQALVVEALRLDQGKRDIAVEAGVVGEIDPLLPTL